MSWDNLRRKTVLNRNDIFYFIYSILYRYILVALLCIISLDILYPYTTNQTNFNSNHCTVTLESCLSQTLTAMIT